MHPAPAANVLKSSADHLSEQSESLCARLEFALLGAAHAYAAIYVVNELERVGMTVWLQQVL